MATETRKVAKRYTPTDALMAQVADIETAIATLEAARDAIHDSTDPDSANWTHVAEQAHVTDWARQFNAYMDEIAGGRPRG